MRHVLALVTRHAVAAFCRAFRGPRGHPLSGAPSTPDAGTSGSSGSSGASGSSGSSSGSSGASGGAIPEAGANPPSDDGTQHAAPSDDATTTTTTSGCSATPPRSARDAGVLGPALAALLALAAGRRRARRAT
jgi:hypothetical protein